jgi:SAM-dependent methyltransferase
MARHLNDAFRRLRNLAYTLLILSDYIAFRRGLKDTQSRFPIRWRDFYPRVGEKTESTAFDRHYVYHPAWAARVLARTKPESHTDISSALQFSAILSAFVPVKFYDYRMAHLDLSNFSSSEGDLVHLPFPDDSVMSLSSMHTVEHVGLGRYGDQIDPDGDLKAMNELKRVVAPGGSLLFVVPIGKPRIAFNAHRIYSYKQVREHFSDLTLKEFALIPQHVGDGGLVYNASPEQADKEDYGCGCFWFLKEP